MIQIDMPMPEKCNDCIFCDDNCSCVASEYNGLGINVGCAYRTERRDIRCPLKEQDEQKRKWLQNIADNQLANAPTDTMDATSHTYYDGVWHGLQMAWDIITGRSVKWE